jgi:hypothetical protein
MSHQSAVKRSALKLPVDACMVIELARMPRARGSLANSMARGFQSVRPIGLVLFGVLFSLAGCAERVDPKIEEWKNKLVMQQEPDNPVTPTKAKDLLAEENDVVLIGKVGAGKLDPFEKGKAVVVLSEAPEDHGDSANHDASECPFCKRRLEEAPIAQVDFCDSNGSVIPYGLQQVVGIKVGQIVIVKGRGHYDKESDMLFVKADSLFVKSNVK